MSVDTVKQQIVELTNTKTLPEVNNIYKESLRQLIHIFGSLYYIDGNNNKTRISCTHGNPERIAGRLHTDNTLVLPFVTVSEVETQIADDRIKYRPVLVHEVFWDPSKLRAVRLLSLAPRAVNISYDINIWCKYKADMDMIRSSIFSLFNPDLNIQTLHTGYAKAFIQRERDIGSQIAGDTQDRILRKSISLSLETYIPSPRFCFTNTGEISEFNAEMALENESNSRLTVNSIIGPAGESVLDNNLKTPDEEEID